MAESDKGIRPYGPGKFSTKIDEYAYEVTLDGGADQEVGGEGEGWYGCIDINDATADRIRGFAADQKDELTDEEEDLLDASVAVIFFERSDGIVEAEWFDNDEDADEAWGEIEDGGDDDGDDDDDLDEEE